MSNIKELSDKFAMKLGLESRPSQMFEDMYEDEDDGEDFRASEMTLNYIPREPNNAIRKQLYEIKVVWRDLLERVELQQDAEALELVEYLIKDLQELKNLMKMRAGR